MGLLVYAPDWSLECLHPLATYMDKLRDIFCSFVYCQKTTEICNIRALSIQISNLIFAVDPLLRQPSYKTSEKSAASSEIQTWDLCIGSQVSRPPSHTQGRHINEYLLDSISTFLYIQSQFSSAFFSKINKQIQLINHPFIKRKDRFSIQPAARLECQPRSLTASAPRHT